MKLVHSDLTETLLDEKSKYTEWIIESSGLFSKYVVELKEQVSGEEGKFVLSDKNKEIDIKKKVEIIIDPFSIDVNDRKILTKLYSELSVFSMNEQLYLETVDLRLHIQEYMSKLEQCTEHILEFNEEVDIPALLKAVNFRYETQDMSLPEKVIQYVKVLSTMTGIRIFVFVNLRSYLQNNQIQNLIIDMQYLDIMGIFIENSQRSPIKGVEQHILDSDMCEI